MAAVDFAKVFKIVQARMTESPDQTLARSSTLLTNTAHIKDVSADTYDWAVGVSGFGGRSHTALEAESNDVNLANAVYRVSVRSDYSHRVLNGRLIRTQMEGGVKESFLDFLKAERGFAIGALGMNLAKALHGSRTGRRAIVGSISTNTVTLASNIDAITIHVGDKIVFSATNGGALRDSGDFVTVTAVDVQAGVITFDNPVVATVTGAAAGDSMYVKGDLNATWNGWDDYNPATAPTTGDSVFGPGVDRSVNPSHLAGLRVVLGGTPTLKDFLISAMAQAKTVCPTGDFDNAICYMNPVDSARLRIALNTDRVIDNANPYQFNIKSFAVGEVTVMDDLFCPVGQARIAARDALEIHSIRGAQVDSTDGNTIVRKGGDQYAIAANIDAAVVCKKPWALARVSIPNQ